MGRNEVKRVFEQHREELIDRTLDESVGLEEQFQDMAILEGKASEESLKSSHFEIEAEDSEEETSETDSETSDSDNHCPPERFLDCGFDQSSNSIIDRTKEYFQSRLARKIPLKIYEYVFASRKTIFVSNFRPLRVWAPAFLDDYSLCGLQLTSSLLFREITAFIKEAQHIYSCSEFGQFDAMSAAFRIGYRNEMCRSVYEDYFPTRTGSRRGKS